MRISEEVQLGRAKNLVLNYFEQRLSVPRIYLNAVWAGGEVDVLAIDRDGVGDVHAAILFREQILPSSQFDRAANCRSEERVLERFSSVPAQFKYVVRVSILANSDPWHSEDILEKSFAPDGIGRFGFLRVSLPAEGEPKISVEIKAERFRAHIAKLADEYVAQHPADWEIRP